MPDDGQKDPDAGERRFRPRIGRDFDMEDVHVIEARTRGFLSRTLCIGCGAALGISGGYGIATGQYGAVNVVWAVSGPLVGAMATYYFGWFRRGVP